MVLHVCTYFMYNTFWIKALKITAITWRKWRYKKFLKKIQMQRSARNSHLLMKNPSQFPFENLPILAHIVSIVPQ